MSITAPSTAPFIAPPEPFMRAALSVAKLAAELGEVPVGAVLVHNNVIVAAAHNQPILSHDPTAHAEIQLLRMGGKLFGNYRLEDCDLYVTLEPCVMCAGAIVHARIRRLVFAARDLRFGGVRSKFQLADSPLLNHQVEVVEGLLGAEATAMLQEFFASRR